MRVTTSMIAVRPPISGMRSPASQQQASMRSTQKGVRFGMCPVCLAILATLGGGSVIGGAAWRLFRRRTNGEAGSQVNWNDLFGQGLSARFLAKLDDIRTRTPNVLRDFVSDPERGSKPLMDAVGKDLEGELLEALQRKRTQHKPA